MRIRRWKIDSFWSVVLTLAAVYAFVKWGIPAASRQITSLPFPLSVPGTLMFIYMALTVVALFLLVTFSQDTLDEFLRPIRKLLRAEYGKGPRRAVLVLVPLLLGWQVYDMTMPRAELPPALRIQHPSSNFPRNFETLQNPFADPSEADVEAFIEEARASEITLIPQVRADIERWMEENPGRPMLGFFPAGPVGKFLSELQTGSPSRETAKAALVEKYLFEGRALYAMNCRACHGDSVGGDGPMADGFKLRPINFTDNGTLETIVEGYAFWRIASGGLGLPTEATPWDSAMPEWKRSLSEEERWKILMAEYDLAQKTPRIPEAH